MSDTETIPLKDPGPEAIEIALRPPDTKMISDPKGEPRPVLLVHGASANHGTFELTGTGLAGYLATQGFEPWLLDWRGSGLVVQDPANAVVLKQEGPAFNFNLAASFDVITALRTVRARTGVSRLPVIGHCMGAAVVAEAIAVWGAAEYVDRAVLSTLGLFYAPPLDSRLKTEERILERLATRGDVSINPTVKSRAEDGTFTLEVPWPQEFERMYRSWSGRLQPHPGTASVIEETCNRLTFMYGSPYQHARLPPLVHDMTPSRPDAAAEPLGEDTTPKFELGRQFGAIPLHMYIHAAANIREGRATLLRQQDAKGLPYNPVSDNALREFGRLDRVTLITGDVNRLWHRESIDRMYEWLCRSTARGRFAKRVFRGYGHQDLLWGEHAADDVYPVIAEALKPPVRSVRVPVVFSTAPAPSPSAPPLSAV